MNEYSSLSVPKSSIREAVSIVFNAFPSLSYPYPSIVIPVRIVLTPLTVSAFAITGVPTPQTGQTFARNTMFSLPTAKTFVVIRVSSCGTPLDAPHSAHTSSFPECINAVHSCVTAM